MNRKKTMSNPSFSTTMLTDQSAAEAFAAINNVRGCGVGKRGAQ